MMLFLRFLFFFFFIIHRSTTSLLNPVPVHVVATAIPVFTARNNGNRLRVRARPPRRVWV